LKYIAGIVFFYPGRTPDEKGFSPFFASPSDR